MGHLGRGRINLAIESNCLRYVIFTKILQKYYSNSETSPFFKLMQLCVMAYYVKSNNNNNKINKKINKYSEQEVWSASDCHNQQVIYLPNLKGFITAVCLKPRLQLFL